MKIDWNQESLAEGLRCYRRQQFFQAHEHWEVIWLQCQEPQKSFLQALIQMAAAFHHLQRSNSRGAASLLNASLRKLERYPSQFAGVDVESLRAEMGAWLPVLEARDQPLRPPFPRIRFLLRPPDLAL
jgi:predicted metal-dependent hydrolase